MSFRSGSHHITPLSKFSTGFPLLLEESSSSSFPIECPWDLGPCHLSDPTPCIPFCRHLVPQPHHFSCEGTSTPSSFPSQIFCASCSLCWKHSSPRSSSSCHFLLVTCLSWNITFSVSLPSRTSPLHSLSLYHFIFFGHFIFFHHLVGLFIASLSPA